MKELTEEELKHSLSFLEKGDPLGARQTVESLFEHDLESKKLKFINRCCTFWIDANKRLVDLTDPLEQGMQLLADWKQLKSFLGNKEIEYDQAFYSLQKGYFLSALQYFTKLFDEKDLKRKAEIYKNAGICYKKMGNFEDAKACLSEANSFCAGSSSILAELADSYTLCGEERSGKILFREAFFIEPEKIDIEYLDSELIKLLIQKTKEKGYFGRALLLWIPVYGTISGILNMKRTLSSQEVCHLKQDIYAMENELKNPSPSAEFITPRLLNYYFWLADHYHLTHESSDKVNEVLLKIKILDTNIHEMYAN